MSTVSKTFLIGNLGDDPKLITFEGGSSICKFPLATSESYTDKSSGEKKTITEWHSIVVKGKSSVNCEKYLKKGSKVYIEGQNKRRKWQDKDGNDRYSTDVATFSVVFLDSKDSQGGVPESQPNRTQPEPFQNKPEEDDLPF